MLKWTCGRGEEEERVLCSFLLFLAVPENAEGKTAPSPVVRFKGASLLFPDHRRKAPLSAEEPPQESQQEKRQKKEESTGAQPIAHEVVRIQGSVN